MTKYDITYITSEDLKEAPVKKEIEDLGGKILSVSVLGEKQLAYPVKKQTSGIYTTVIFEMEGEKVLELNKKLNLKNEIFRHLIINYKAIPVPPVKPTLAEEPKKSELEVAPETAIEKEPIKAIEKEPEKEIVPEEVVEKETEIVPAVEAEGEPVKKEEAKKVTPKKEKAVKAKEEKPAKKESPKVKEAFDEEMSQEDRLKALDKKLDELLKE